MNNKATELFYSHSTDKKTITIEITLDTYNTLLLRSLKYDILKKSIVGSIRKYVSGNGLYLDSNLLEVFALMFPEEYERRANELTDAEVLLKEGDLE